MLGLWNEYYADGAEREYGNPETYRLAAAWLNGHGRVEDWGCGTKWASKFIRDYRGVDGSGQPDVVEDLRHYRSETPCILLRHVLEHNLRWREILDNALASFQKRMVIVTFRAMTDGDKVEWWQDGIPTMNLCRQDFLSKIAPYSVGSEVCDEETIFYLEKQP